MLFCKLYAQLPGLVSYCLATYVPVTFHVHSGALDNVLLAELSISFIFSVSSEDKLASFFLLNYSP